MIHAGTPRAERAGGTLDIWVSGDLDHDERDAVIQLLDEHATAELHEVVFHLAEVRFVASAGLATLLYARRLVDAQGGRVTLIDPSANLIRLLDVSGVTGLFSIKLS